MINKDDPLPLYYQLVEQIKAQITSGQIKVGDKLPSESEMVEIYGLGRLTIRGALARLVNDGFLKKIHGKGTFCIASRAKADRIDIDVILDVAYTYFIPYYVKSISSVLLAHNCNFIISDSHDNSDKIADILDGIYHRGSSGVIVQPSRCCKKTPERIKKTFGQLRAAGIPYIMIDSIYEGIESSYTVLDEYKGGAMAARFFYELGHRRLAIVSIDQYRDSLQRREGFTDTCDLLKLPPPLLISWGTGRYTGRGDTGREKNLAKKLKSEGITALFCYNDELAVRCLRILKTEGIAVPGDISVLGFDDTVLAATVEPALTTIAHPKQIMGKLAAQALLDMMNKKTPWPFVRVFKPRLIKRASCKPAAL
jgi:GntR family transcriptional regulator of arabinose operon